MPDGVRLHGAFMSHTKLEWPELIEDIQLELKLLRELLERTAEMRRTVADAKPDQTAKLAAATLLQSFYNGIEKVLDAMAERVDGDRPEGEDRHGRLLAQMAEPRGDRPAVISGPLRDGLAAYLEFRNSYRYGYYFRLDWPQAAGLIEQCEATLDRFERDLDTFFREHAGCRLIGRPQPEGLPEFWFAPPQRPIGIERPATGRRLAWAFLLGVVLTLGIGKLAEHFRAGPAVKTAPAAEVRELIAPLAAPLTDWEADPNVRHAAGVLGFFDRDDWAFTYTGDDWRRTGDLPGRCPSLEATAALGFVDGRVVRIEITTAHDRHAFTASAGRLRRAARHALPSGRPVSMIDFGPNAAPACITHWTDTDAGPTRTQTFYQDGRAVLRITSGPDGSVLSVVLRAGTDTPKERLFRMAKGSLQPMQAATQPLQDLSRSSPTPQRRSWGEVAP